MARSDSARRRAAVHRLAVPLLATHLLGERDMRQKEGAFIAGLFHRGYAGLMRALLPHPWLVLLPIAPLLAILLPGRQMPKEMP